MYLIICLVSITNFILNHKFIADEHIRICLLEKKKKKNRISFLANPIQTTIETFDWPVFNFESALLSKILFHAPGTAGTQQFDCSRPDW